jgi:hypothetical protein
MVEVVYMSSKETRGDECVELKNIKYKTMLMNGSNVQETKSEHDMSNLEKFLEAEKTSNMAEPWTKLDKTIKTQKMRHFVDSYAEQHHLKEDDKKTLLTYLKDCLSKKKLARVKDVIYDKETGKIKDIPLLVFNKQSRQFTLKRGEKRVSTLKSLNPSNKCALKSSIKKDDDEPVENEGD